MPHTTTVRLCGLRIPVHIANTLVVGSGAASLNCAVHLHQFGVTNLLIATERLGGGASNLSGSDKQTYYKLSVAGSTPDSPYQLARALFDGGAMHGDIALVEATLSAQEFFHLVSLGVQFPHDRYGAYIGYKTDHDPSQRATSAGPRTSNQMVECLVREVRARGIPILDWHEVVALLTAQLNGEPHVIGALAIDKARAEDDALGLVLFNCRNVVFGTGGPGGMYRSSVYPEGQVGSIGIALEAGAVAQNLTESQFGLSSLRPRWNVSGTYQQVIPAYVSTAQDGSDEREFLNPYFPSMGKLATDIFLKGYQWPFDARKVAGHGSSLIDLLCYTEGVVRGRRVFMEFRRNPSAKAGLGEFRFEDLEPEAYRYLERSGALFGTPIERLRKMNPLAAELYLQHGIDLAKEPLEVTVCAQHNNGGLKGSIWWESNVRHLFPVGEVNGTHGVYRPGGASLNSGQVGGYRAAQYIAARYAAAPPPMEDWLQMAAPQARNRIEHCLKLAASACSTATDGEDVRSEIQTRMTLAAAHVREPARVRAELANATALWRRVRRGVRVRSRAEVLGALQNEALCLTHAAYLAAIDAYLQRGGGSRGSYLVLDPSGDLPCPGLEEWRYRPENPALRGEICEIWLRGNATFGTRWVQVRPIPENDSWFETVWAQWREGRVFDRE